MKYRLWIILFLIFLFAGCPWTKKLEPPQVNLTNIELNEFKFLESSFILELNARNPNDVPLQVKGVNCVVDLNGKHFASGVSEVNEEIPAFGSATIPVVVQSSAWKLFKGAYGLAGGLDKLKYNISGTMHLQKTETFMPAKVPFNSEGEVSFTDVLEEEGF
jgi:LEA14-like dessication related protein